MIRKNAKTITSPYGSSFKRGQKVYSHGDPKTYGFIKDWDYSNGTWLLQIKLGDNSGFRWWPEGEPTTECLDIN